MEQVVPFIKGARWTLTVGAAPFINGGSNLQLQVGAALFIKEATLQLEPNICITTVLSQEMAVGSTLLIYSRFIAKLGTCQIQKVLLHFEVNIFNIFTSVRAQSRYWI